MPLPPGEAVSTAIRELHSGKTYARTKSRYGKKKADKQAVAIALRNRRLKKTHGKKHHKAVKRTRKH